MEELKYCRACLVTDVKMYSLDITSNDSIGLIYTQLAQIDICFRNQYICFECASLLQKYQKFKSKCITANNILSSIAGNTTEITKQVILNIDRKASRLESCLKVTKELLIDCYSEVFRSNVVTLEAGVDTNVEELKVKTEIQVTDLNETQNAYNVNEFVCTPENNISIKTQQSKKKIKIIKEPKTKKRKPKNQEQIEGIFDGNKSRDNVEGNKFYNSNDTSTNKKVKLVISPKATKRKIKTEELATEEEICDNNESLDDFNDNDLMESCEENADTGINEYKETKVETVASEDNLSDKEPLSKRKQKQEKTSVIKRNGQNLDFFDDYATIVFLTTEDAKKELLSRKDSNNYKRSPFKCNFCYKGYEAKTAFDTHMKKHTSEHGDYDCDICHLRFLKQIYLCKHKLSCHRRKFSCKICPYICYCMYQARTHVTMHKGTKYPCKDCGEIFSMPNSLQMHKRVHHRNVATAESACELCGDVFASKRGVFLHNMKVHRTDKNSKQGPKCEECGVHFDTEVAWKRHLVLSTKHTVINGCKFCGERFQDEEELKAHRRTHHSRNRKEYKTNIKLPGTCSICNKWLRSRIEYSTHMTTEHPQCDETMTLNPCDLTPFVCEVCGQVFKKQCFLRYHQRKHTGERPYKCSTCGKSFPSAAGRDTHHNTHSRRRTCKCDICARLFSSKNALNKHMKGHLGIRPHKCTLCDKGFLHMCDLKVHIKYVHDKVPWPKKKTKRNIADESAPYLD
ncbi:uncharacterized protein LOC142975957 [Anticarsia gemmatalis]|uniref:uncharacterized protein LOC142975957 n=1 Tax=Anticarsia gemmatalis TaxID=129554 RepID=UPI003F75E021